MHRHSPLCILLTTARQMAQSRCFTDVCEAFTEISQHGREQHAEVQLDKGFKELQAWLAGADLF